jgi:hypothetical protein
MPFINHLDQTSGRLAALTRILFALLRQYSPSSSTYTRAFLSQRLSSSRKIEGFNAA